MQQPSLLNAILKHNHSGLTDTGFLQEVSRQHPYFIPAQFYLLQQMQDNNEGYNAQAAKATVLFNNAHWLHFQLHHPEINAIEKNAAIVPAAFLHPENSDNDDDNIAVNSTEPESIVVTVDSTTQNPPSIDSAIPSIKLPAENSDNDDDIITVNTTEPESVIVEENTTPISQPLTEAPTLTAEQLMLAENSDNDDDGIMEEEIAPLKIIMPTPTFETITEDTLTFEPMHRVDYFASQGIKLSEEVQTADKLGMQLKSFTAWLKTMKKIHIPESEANAGIADMIIQTLAAKSNAEGEIVTEAMAEVLTQQGKAGKAIEVYKKLSLLNPAKSAFFAAKIEQLKG